MFAARGHVTVWLTREFRQREPQMRASLPPRQLTRHGLQMGPSAALQTPLPTPARRALSGGHLHLRLFRPHASQRVHDFGPDRAAAAFLAVDRHSSSH
jgi:hypothetical protein